MTAAAKGTEQGIHRDNAVSEATDHCRNTRQEILLLNMVASSTEE